MNYQGDITLGETIDIKFTTVASNGVPATLTGSPAVAAYVDNSIVEIAAGVILSVDFDGRVGLHNVRVVASSGNGFTTGSNVFLVLTSGTVAGNSVVGYVIGSFSVSKRPVNVVFWAGIGTTSSNIAIKNSLAKGTEIVGFNDLAAGSEMSLIPVYDSAKAAASQTSVNAIKSQTDQFSFASGDVKATLDGELVALTSSYDKAKTAAQAGDVMGDSPGVTTLLSRVSATLFSGMTSLGQWLGLLTGKQAGNTIARNELRATGAGNGTYDETSDSLEAIRNHGDEAWVGGGGAIPPIPDDGNGACAQNPALTRGPTTQPDPNIITRLRRSNRSRRRASA